MRNLYKVTGFYVIEDAELESNTVVQDILLHWKPNYNLFPISQISDRNNTKRPTVRRIVNRLIKCGVVERA